ncbi:MAG: carbohydrate binding domain-containing protein, partial [Gammaproteobacteria bacterium]|nr:carbohydrate binding domain-containing protein [Gammaproteobacteria bacterium]
MNLVNNWDFEDGVVDPWRLIFRGGSGGVGEFLIDGDEFLTGQASLKIEISEGGTHKRALHVIQQPLMEAVQSGTDYTYSAWIKAEEERTLFMNLIRSGGGAIVTPNNLAITVGQEWGEYWHTVTATSDGEIRVEFEIGLSDADIWIDHVRFYEGDYVEEALGQAPGLASNPSPADEAADVVREVVLAWSAAATTVKRNVYLGTNWDDVNDANPANPLNVLVGQDLTDTSLDVGTLAFDQIYYWRVDEVNGAPDHTVFPGDVWRFTVEPIGYPITSITATASGSFGDSVPEKTINGSGLVDDLHGTTATDMWISGGIPATIEYAFDRVYKLHELWVWNSNQTIESFIGFGAKDIVLEHSLDGENWTVLEGVGPLAQGPGTGGYAHNNTIGLGAAVAQHVRMTINSVQGFAPQASLSEIRFLFIPTTATRPSPATGATDVSPDVTLSWGRDGREADRHEVYVGTDPNNLPFAGDVSESSFDTLALDLQLGQSYAWHV